MKYLIILISLTLTLMACTGDCMTCHPKLVPTINEDLRHKPMLTCIECHSPDPSAMAECGSDCFACHPMEKINKMPIEQHRIINECRDCHMKMKAEMAEIPLESGQTHRQPLKEFLLTP